MGYRCQYLFCILSGEKKRNAFLTAPLLLNPFNTAVPTWVQNTWIQSVKSLGVGNGLNLKCSNRALGHEMPNKAYPMVE